MRFLPFQSLQQRRYRHAQDLGEALKQGRRRRVPAALPLEGYPWVLDLAWPFVTHTDSRFEPETLHRFVQRFRRHHVVTIGALWAVPIALRQVLLENLRHLTEAGAERPRGSP